MARPVRSCERAVAAGPGQSPAWRHYLRAVFRAGAFRAVVLRATVLRAGAFFAAAFLAGAFFAGALATATADLPAALTASSVVGYAPFASFGALAGAHTPSLN